MNPDINRKSNINRLSSLSLGFQNGENNDIEIRGRLVCMEKLNRVSQYYPVFFPSLPSPFSAASFISSYDSRFDAELLHGAFADCSSGSPTVNCALPKYRNRAGADNAFNILARYPIMNLNRGKIHPALLPGSKRDRKRERETHVTWEIHA